MVSEEAKEAAKRKKEKEEYKERLRKDPLYTGQAPTEEAATRVEEQTGVRPTTLSTSMGAPKDITITKAPTIKESGATEFLESEESRLGGAPPELVPLISEGTKQKWVEEHPFLSGFVEKIGERAQEGLVGEVGKLGEKTGLFKSFIPQITDDKSAFTKLGKAEDLAQEAFDNPEIAPFYEEIVKTQVQDQINGEIDDMITESLPPEMLPPIQEKSLVAGVAGTAVIAAVTGYLVSEVKGQFGTAVNIQNKLGNLETSVVNLRETASFIESAVTNGSLHPEDALRKLNYIEDIISSIEAEMQQAAILSLKVRTTAKKMEIETRIFKAREDMYYSRIAISKYYYENPEPTSWLTFLSKIQNTK